MMSNKNCYDFLGAENNDSASEKWVIVKFYTSKYQKCGDSNPKNDGRICMGASAFLKSVDFRAFAVNVKTIHWGNICINLDTQYGLRTTI